MCQGSTRGQEATPGLAGRPSASERNGGGREADESKGSARTHTKTSETQFGDKFDGEFIDPQLK